MITHVYKPVAHNTILYSSDKAAKPLSYLIKSNLKKLSFNLKRDKNTNILLTEYIIILDVIFTMKFWPFFQ